MISAPVLYQVLHGRPERTGEVGRMADPQAAVAGRIDEFRGLILSTAQTYTVAPALLYALIHQESGGDPDAYRVEPAVQDLSVGLMQLLVGTTRALGYPGPLRFLFDPSTNLALGTQLLARLIRDHRSEWEALLAYNGGEGAVQWFRRGWKTGPAVHYANTVWALRAYYERREAARAAAPAHG